MRLTRSLAGVALVLLTAAPIRAHQTPQQTPPVFRAGVDLVVVDVVVLDKNGQPVIDLTAADFEVVAGRRPRRIISSEFVGVTRVWPTAITTASLGLSEPTSNRRTATGRSILFVVDVEEIRAGEGRGALRAISEYLEALGPDDRAGLVSLPYGTPRVDLTTDRRLLKEATGLIAGASNRMREVRMTPGEAAGIALGDTGAFLAHWERTSGLRNPGATGAFADSCPGPPRPFDPPMEVPEQCKVAAQRAQDVHFRHTRVILDSLRALAAAMAPLDGPKALVLVSEGINNDPQIRDALRDFADAAERARVALYALHLDAPLAEASTSGGPTIGTRILDDRLGFDGMAELAYAARGTAIRVIGTAANALRRIDAELSGYYLLSFERSPDDRDHVGIDVKVKRPDLDVRARKEFKIEPAAKPETKPKAPPDPKAAMGTLLRWPAPVREIGIDVDTFTSPADGTSPDVRVMIAAEIATGRRAVTVGFEVKDAKGQVVADTFDPQTVLRALADGRALYPVTIVVPPGRYTLTLGVIDADGRRGSVTHAFDAPAWPAGPLRMSSVTPGEISGGAFRPIVLIGPAMRSVAVRVEVHATAAEAFAGSAVRIEMLRRGETTALSSLAGPLATSTDPLRRAATSVLDIGHLPPGDYVIRVTLEGAGGQVLAQQARMLRKP